MEKEIPDERPFQYTPKSTSKRVDGGYAGQVVKIRDEWNWSSDDSSEPGLIQLPPEKTTGFAIDPRYYARDNILESMSESGETIQGSKYFSESKSEYVMPGMELDETEIGILCDFVDGDDQHTIPDINEKTVDDILTKVCRGGAVLDTYEPRYQRDLRKREENTRKQDAKEKVTMGEIWELIRCQEGFKEHSQRNLHGGVNKAANGDCGKIEFVLEEEREAANYQEKKQFYDRMKNMEEQIKKLQDELEAAKRPTASVTANNIQDNPKKDKTTGDVIIDFIFGDEPPKQKKEKKKNDSTCAIS